MADDGHAKISVAHMQLPDGSVAASVAQTVSQGTALKAKGQASGLVRSLGFVLKTVVR
jgi:hypothetical protein